MMLLNASVSLRSSAAGTSGSVLTPRRAFAAFHAAIGTAAHNRAITRLVHAIMDLLGQSREESINTPGRAARSHQDHRRIVQAIARRDSGAARQAMLDHLVAVEALVFDPSDRPRGA